MPVTFTTYILCLRHMDLFLCPRLTLFMQKLLMMQPAERGGGGERVQGRGKGTRKKLSEGILCHLTIIQMFYFH